MHRENWTSAPEESVDDGVSQVLGAAESLKFHETPDGGGNAKAQLGRSLRERRKKYGPGGYAPYSWK